MTKYGKTAVAQADEIREMTADEIKALPGLLGFTARAMTKEHGAWGYKDAATGRKVCIVVKG